MSDEDDFHGRPLPARWLEEWAAEFRRDLDLNDADWTFDILRVAWRAASLSGRTFGLQILPRPDEYMEDKDAWAMFDPPRIEIKQSKYREAAEHQPDSRFLVAHELSHILLHDGPRRFRSSSGPKRLNYLSLDPALEVIHADGSGEVQADQGARAFLMPPAMVREAGSPAALALRCVVPLKQARIRFDQIYDGPKQLPVELQAEIEALRQTASKHSQHRVEGMMQRIERLWNELPLIEGEDGTEFRNAKGWRVARSQYLRMTQCGWRIHEGEIRAYLDFYCR